MQSGNSEDKEDISLSLAHTKLCYNLDKAVIIMYYEFLVIHLISLENKFEVVSQSQK